MADKIDNQIEYYSSIAERENIRSSVWSMFDITDLDAPVPFTIKTIEYKTHWGEHTVVISNVITETWIDLWRVLDLAIRMSGDTHHIFIERLNDCDNGTYELVTGS